MYAYVYIYIHPYMHVLPVAINLTPVSCVCHTSWLVKESTAQFYAVQVLHLNIQPGGNPSWFGG